MAEGKLQTLELISATGVIEATRKQIDDILPLLEKDSKNTPVSPWLIEHFKNIEQTVSVVFPVAQVLCTVDEYRDLFNATTTLTLIEANDYHSHAKPDGAMVYLKEIADAIGAIEQILIRLSFLATQIKARLANVLNTEDSLLRQAVKDMDVLKKEVEEANISLQEATDRLLCIEYYIEHPKQDIQHAQQDPKVAYHRLSITDLTPSILRKIREEHFVHAKEAHSDTKLLFECKQLALNEMKNRVENKSELVRNLCASLNALSFPLAAKKVLLTDYKRLLKRPLSASVFAEKQQKTKRVYSRPFTFVSTR